MLSKEVLSFEGDDVCALNDELLFVVGCCCCVCCCVMGVAVRAARRALAAMMAFPTWSAMAMEHLA